MTYKLIGASVIINQILPIDQTETGIIFIIYCFPKAVHFTYGIKFKPDDNSIKIRPHLPLSLMYFFRYMWVKLTKELLSLRCKDVSK